MSECEKAKYIIKDLEKHDEPIYFVCLEDWSGEMKEAGKHKENWYHQMKDKGLGVKLAVDTEGRVGGMIQYLPIDFSPASGEDLYFITCIWVHGYKKGRGNFQGQGMGKALLKAAEKDVKNRGAKGIAAWGMILPLWMKASWFKKQGYIKADRKGIQSLLWKPFGDNAKPPHWVGVRKKPDTIEGKVLVTALINGWCPAMNLVHERARRASAEFGDKVKFQSINTRDPENFNQWGLHDALFIDGKNASKGPPLSYDKIKRKIGKRVRKLKK